MATLVRLLRSWSMLQQHCCSCTTLQYLHFSPSLPVVATKLSFYGFSSATVLHSASRGDRHPLRGLRSPNSPPLSELQVEESTDSDSGERKSRNQMKREAQRAVRWAMQLASFSAPQIKRILKVASLDKDVLDALMLVKKLGPDVREGKRRQFNYIGKLLRDVEPELMDVLIQATKDGDHSMLQALTTSKAGVVLNDDGDEEEEIEESEYEEEEKGSHNDIANRWLHGLITKDINITNEVYSVQGVEYDRQELRKLVRKLHIVQEAKEAVTEEKKAKEDAKIKGARRSLTRFLVSIAKQMPTE